MQPNRLLRPAVIALGLALSGATTHSAPEVTASVGFVSDYIFRGQRLAGASVQPTLEVSGGAFSAGVSSSAALRHRAADVARFETDVFAAQRWALRSNLSGRLGVVGYFYRDAPSDYRRAVFEPNLALDYSVGHVRFTPAYYYDLNRKGGTIELSAAAALPLKDIGSELDLTLTAGAYRLHDAFSTPGPDTALRGDYWQLDASVPLQITFRSRITVGGSYVVTRNASLQRSGGPRFANPLATDRASVRISYSYAF